MGTLASTRSPQTEIGFITTVPSASESPPLQRIKEVREIQGTPRITIAKAVGTDIEGEKRLEEPTTDIPLSTLHKIAAVCRTSVAELIVEPENDDLSPFIRERAKTVRAMKLAETIRKHATTPQMRLLAEMLIEELRGIMPEVKKVEPLHLSQLKKPIKLGKAWERMMPDVGLSEEIV